MRAMDSRHDAATARRAFFGARPDHHGRSGSSDAAALGRDARARSAERTRRHRQEHRTRRLQRVQRLAGDRVLRCELFREARRSLRDHGEAPAVCDDAAVSSHFPDPRSARGDIVAIGDALSVELLRDAYRHGIFPWPHEAVPTPWFSPRKRAVIFFDELHVGRSLAKSRKRAPFTFTIDRDFETVIRSCSATPRPDQDGTWITPSIVRAYTALHQAGDAHSVEAWNGDELAGGLYGIDAGGLFTGESMFFREPDASKLALLFLIDQFRGRGATWLDIQVMTPHMAALGAREITRAKFLDLLEETQARKLALF